MRAYCALQCVVLIPPCVIPGGRGGGGCMADLEKLQTNWVALWPDPSRVFLLENSRSAYLPSQRADVNNYAYYWYIQSCFVERTSPRPNRNLSKGFQGRDYKGVLWKQSREGCWEADVFGTLYNNPHYDSTDEIKPQGASLYSICRAWRMR